MEITKKVFWTEAMKGGTIIGLAVVAFEVLLFSSGVGRWLYYVELAVFALLLYAFTRRMAAKTEPIEGFQYSRCMGFVIAMMIFTGVIGGVYMSVMNNFVNTSGVSELVDVLMLPLQDTLPQTQFDAMYETMYASYRNPLILVFASVMAYVIQGGIIGLFTSALAQRKPDIFGSRANSEDNNVKTDDRE